MKQPKGSGNVGRLRMLVQYLGVVTILSRIWCTPAFAELVTTHTIKTDFAGTSYHGHPTVLELPGGQMVAVWDKMSSWSTDQGATWSAPLLFPYYSGYHGNMQCVIPWNADTVLMASQFGSGGPTIAISKGEFSFGLLVWGPPVYAVPKLNPGSGHPDPYDDPQLAIDRTREILYLVYGHQTPVTFGLASSRVTLVRSLDRGATWSEPLPLSNHFSNGGRPVVGPDGEVYVVWHDLLTKQIRGRKSADFGVSFGDTFVVANVRHNRSRPTGYNQVDERVNPVPESGVSNLPAFGVDTSDGPFRGSLYVTWVDQVAGDPDAGSGRTIVPTEPNDRLCSAVTEASIGDDVVGDDAPIENPDYEPDYGETIAFMATGGTTLWIEAETTNYPTASCPYSFLLYREDAAGVTLVGNILTCGYGSGSARPLVHSVPSTARYYLWGTGYARRFYEYRVRLRTMTPAASGGSADARDVVLARSTDGGASWSVPRRVSDGPPLYDDAFPNLAVDGSGRVHVAWYGRHGDPLTGAKVQTYLRSSQDGGASFDPSRALDGTLGIWGKFDQPPGCSFYSVGEVGDRVGLSVSGNDVFVSWIRPHPTVPSVMAASIVGDSVTAVAVSRFAGAWENGRVRLSWHVRDPSGIERFRVLREENGGFAPVAGGDVQTDRAGEHEVWDADVTPGARYRYRLEASSSSGWRAIESPIEVMVPMPRGSLEWRRATPNPFRERVELGLVTELDGPCTVVVYDVAGKRVAWLHRGPLAAGEHAMVWDGRDATGRVVRAGIYSIRAEVGDVRSTIRVARIR